MFPVDAFQPKIFQIKGNDHNTSVLLTFICSSNVCKCSFLPMLNRSLIVYYCDIVQMYFVESGIVFMKCEYYTKVWACWIDSSTGYCCVQLHAERTLSRVEAGFPPKSPLRNQLQLLLHHILKFHSPVPSWAASISVQIEDRSVCCWNWFLRSGLLISCRSKEPLQWRRDWGSVSWSEKGYTWLLTIMAIKQKSQNCFCKSIYLD